jgi:anti-sigma regulatory factor (Ser/Thr protein kinase)
MGLFNYVRLPVPLQISEHESSGRFVPITQIRTTSDLRSVITDLIPLLHAPAEVVDPIRYVFSEMVRNALEHSSSPVGAFVCAQYYADSERISIGIADAGIGVLNHMSQSHPVTTSAAAIRLALQPGVSGTTSRMGGNEFNAGAGLFFTKSIASYSRNMFLLYSGDAAYRLMRARSKARLTPLSADPLLDPHRFPTALPAFSGTLVGIDLNVSQKASFAELLEQIRQAYFLDVKRKKDYARKIRFTK